MTIRTLIPALALSLALTHPAYAQDPAATDAKPAPAMTAAKKPMMAKADAQLPPEKAKLLSAAREKMQATTKDIFSQVQKLRDEQKAILSAEAFDKAAYLAKAGEIHALHGKMAQARTDMIAELAPQFTVEERKVLLNEGMHSKGMRGKHRAKRQGN